MTRRIRIACFAVVGTAFAVLLVRGLLGLPDFGEFQGAYGLLLNDSAPGERQVVNIVTSIVYDYRAVDTLAEELILFAAVLGVALLLRPEKEEEEEDREEDELPGREAQEVSEAVRLMGFAFTGVTMLLGIALTMHAHLSPGGGFQGGAVVAAACLLVYVGHSYEAFSRLGNETRLHVTESVGVGSFVLLGLAGLALTGSYLANVLPLGKAGEVLSAGMIPVASAASGLAVGAGLVVIVSNFMRQTLIIRERRQIHPEV